MLAGYFSNKIENSRSPSASEKESNELTFFYMGMKIPIENTPAM